MKSELHRILDRANLAPVTHDKYGRIIDMWIAFAGADPRNWTRLRAQEFYDDLLTRVSVSSASTYLASLRYVSRWYATLHNRPELDFAIVQIKRASHEPAKPRRALTEAEAKNLLDGCTRDRTPAALRDRALIVVGLETGMRRKSLRGLNIEAIALRPFPHVVVPIKGPRGEQTHPVPLSDTALLAIEPWRAMLAKKRIKQGPLFCQFDSFRRPTRLAVSAGRIYAMLVERSRAVDLRDIHPHLLRHTFVTWRQLAGLTPIQIASITGHRYGDNAAPGDAQSWAGMTPYLDLQAIASEARNSTPRWLADLVSTWRTDGSATD